MAFLCNGEHLRILSTPAGANDRRPLANHLPASVAALHPEVRDGNTLRPVPRLHQEDTGDGGVGDFLMRVAVNDHIDPANFARDASGDVLASDVVRNRVVTR